jgi:flagellar P-ring protein precursor FlgI
VTPLTGADGEIYAVAQGAIATSGFLAQGNAATIVQGVPTTARLASGAIVEREVEFELAQLGSFRIALNQPDFTTAMRIHDAVEEVLGRGSAEVKDPGTVEVDIAGKSSLVDSIAAIENQPINPDGIARVVVDDRSGTIVIGSNVRIGKVAISQGGLTVVIDESFGVSQPEPLSIGGTTVVVPETDIEVEERQGGFTILQGDVSLQDLVNGLNAIGVTARQTISILQAIKAAGALHAHLEII